MPEAIINIFRLATTRRTLSHEYTDTQAFVYLCCCRTPIGRQKEIEMLRHRVIGFGRLCLHWICICKMQKMKFLDLQNSKFSNFHFLLMQVARTAQRTIVGRSIWACADDTDSMWWYSCCQKEHLLLFHTFLIFQPGKPSFYVFPFQVVCFSYL